MSQTAPPMPDDRPAGISPSSSYSPELEALRGWAILLVFFFHADGAIFGLDRIGTTVSPPLAFITAGHTGVTLFFVLSAMLLARPFMKAMRGGPSVSRRKFFMRRILRIMPLYTVAVVFGIFMSRTHPDALGDGLRALVFLSSFVGNVQSLIPYSAVWWSLATEIQFYLLLPLFFLGWSHRLGRIVVIALLLGWATCYAVLASDASLLPNLVRFRLSLSVFGRAPAFLFGIAACWIVLHHGPRLRERLAASRWLRAGGADGLLILTLFGLGLLLSAVTHRGFIPSEVQIPAWHIAESGLWTLVVLIVVLAPLKLHALLSNRLLALLGTLSYSIYLVHAPITYFGLGPLVNRGIPVDTEPALRIVAFAAAFALCLAISALTYRLIERPFLLRKSRIGI